MCYDVTKHNCVWSTVVITKRGNVKLVSLYFRLKEESEWFTNKQENKRTLDSVSQLNLSPSRGVNFNFEHGMYFNLEYCKKHIVYFTIIIYFEKIIHICNFILYKIICPNAHVIVFSRPFMLFL